MNGPKQAAFLSLLAVLVSSPASVEGATVFLQEIGPVYWEPLGISADGTVVVGVAPPGEGFRWTSQDGMMGLGALDPNNLASGARGISGNGEVVVGYSSGAVPGGWESFRWTQGGGIQSLGIDPNLASEAYAASFDGSVIVGVTYAPGSSLKHAFRWTAGNAVDLGLLASDPNDLLAWSWATDVSSDGSVVVGASSVAPDIWHAFRWTQAGGMVDLGTLPLGVGPQWIEAHAVSGDGSAVVGGAEYNSAFVTEAFRWTEGGGMVGLGFAPLDPNGYFSKAWDVSEDGSVVVGEAFHPDFIRAAFVWDATNGMRYLHEILIAQGLDLTGWELYRATGVSADGLTIVGLGSTPGGAGAWIAHIPEPSPLSMGVVGVLLAQALQRVWGSTRVKSP